MRLRATLHASALTDAMVTVPSSWMSIVRAGLFGQRANDGAALADHVADLLRIDLERHHPRRVLRDFGARVRQRFLHQLQDVHAAFARLRQRDRHDLLGDALDLDVHLQRRDAAIGAGDLEVHVAEVILVAEDVGQHGEAVAFLDEAHRDARDVRLGRHAGVHQREARAAHRRHRRAAVRLGDLRDDAHRVREFLARRQHRDAARAWRGGRGRSRGASAMPTRPVSPVAYGGML